MFRLHAISWKMKILQLERPIYFSTQSQIEKRHLASHTTVHLQPSHTSYRHRLSKYINSHKQCLKRFPNFKTKLLVNGSQLIDKYSLPVRYMSIDSEKRTKRELTQIEESPYGGLTRAEKVKEVGKDASYLGVIILGVGVTGFMFYTIFHELMSGDSPTGVYKKAYKLCKRTNQITDMLGEPLKAYGEENRRGRRRHVRHSKYEVNGVPHMRVRFYIEGPRGKGTVNLEVQKNTEGNYDYRYLFVELDEFPQRTIILEDNR